MRNAIQRWACVLGVASACGGAPVDSTCTTNADCAGGLVCVDGRCAGCDAAAQCEADLGPGATCVDGRCQPPACPVASVGCSCGPGDTCATGECMGGICVDCERGFVGCRCYDNDRCAAGLRCEGAGCVVCPAGELGCACVDAVTCATGLVCQDLLCVVDPCPAGSRDCPCRQPDDTCDPDLFCLSDGRCGPCSADVVDCPCGEGHVCTNDLVCDATTMLCREAHACPFGCVEQQQCVDAAGADAVCLPSCIAGWLWNDVTLACDPIVPSCTPEVPGSILAACDTAHRECVPDAGDVHCGACLDGTTDEAGRLAACRALFTCLSLECESGLHRVCTPETSTTEAVCGACLTGYEEAQPPGAACVSFVERTCSPGDPGDLTPQCSLEHRWCMDPPDAGAYCGACLTGYAEPEPPGTGACFEIGECGPAALDCAGHNRLCVGTWPQESCGACFPGTSEDPLDLTRCVPPPRCADLDGDDDPGTPPCWETGQYCVEDEATGVPSCESPDCAEAGQAFSDRTGGCVTCGVCSSSEAGLTGRVWPWTLQGSSQCVCETEDGFYWDRANYVAPPCDADGDGWVRGAAHSALSSTDPAERQNARCALRTIDRFVLQNEYAQRLSVHLCEGYPAETTEPGQCPNRRLLPLYEAKSSDDGSTTADTPAYQVLGRGRRLASRELNSLTRACVNETADYNANGVADLAEWQGMTIAGGTELASYTQTYTRFSYLHELYEGFYERGTASLAGQYVIRERSRCDDSTDLHRLPVTYGSEGYWRGCTRSRDVAFDATNDPAEPDFGMDFARWSCAAEYGSCPIPPPPTAELPLPGEPPPHGLCEVALPLFGPADGVWRGMSHHSQFRCVKLGAAAPDQPTLTPAQVGPGGTHAFDDCWIDCPAGDEQCTTDCVGGVCATTSLALGPLPNPVSPKITCATEGAATSGVGLAAIRYIAGAPYQRGCIDEWSPSLALSQYTPWRSLCPGWTPQNPHATGGAGDAADFGRLECGCVTGAYGGSAGLSCEIGCAGASLHVDPDYDFAPRRGFWMCGDPASAGYDTVDPVWGPALISPDALWVLRGDLQPVQSVRLCDPADPIDCSSGYTVK